MACRNTSVSFKSDLYWKCSILFVPDVPFFCTYVYQAIISMVNVFVPVEFACVREFIGEKLKISRFAMFFGFASIAILLCIVALIFFCNLNIILFMLNRLQCIPARLRMMQLPVSRVELSSPAAKS